YPEIAKGWPESDIFDLVNRGTAREAVSSLRPLHLDAHKIRVAKHCRDYNVADAIYALLEFGERQTLNNLRNYLDQGRDVRTSRFDKRTKLDLETLTVLKLVEGLPDLHPSNERVAAAPPTCIGQSRVLCDDVQRLLSYRDEVPRTVMIDYLKTVFGLHIASYTLRLSKQLTGWIKDKQAHPTCLECPVYGSMPQPFAECPYQLSFTVDMGGDFRSRMAQMSQDSVKDAYGNLIDLIKALFTFNQLLRYARDEPKLGIADVPADVLKLLRETPPDFQPDFRAKLKQLRVLNESAEEEFPPEILAILESGMPPFDTFIELVTHVRQKHHIDYLTQMMDKLFQKNTDIGAMVQGKSRNNPRRWHLGGRLLEVLVQLAVLRWTERDGRKFFYSERILIEDFILWLEARYGFVINGSQLGTGKVPVTMEEHRAFRENTRALKDRLREIGFYDDLSDAYIAQTIRPRYPIDERKGAQ
ncbi:MAG: methylation-associated defense system protein MAD7, partial [Pyrinomonadaceae bacterium]